MADTAAGVRDPARPWLRGVPRLAPARVLREGLRAAGVKTPRAIDTMETGFGAGCCLGGVGEKICGGRGGLFRGKALWFDMHARTKGGSIVEAYAAVRLWTFTPKPGQHFLYLCAEVSRPYAEIRPPGRPYAIMRSNGASRYQGKSG
jgi:hypothetical protein